jgi:STE24 endopeptidase
MTLVTIISTIPSIPWNYYYTFVLEEKHGFNKSTKGLWVADQVKTLGLIGILGLPILAGFLRVIEWAGRSFVPWLMLFMYVLTGREGGVADEG